MEGGAVGPIFKEDQPRSIPARFGSLGESGTLLIFKVNGHGHRVKFLLCNILVNTLESTFNL
jgi:hypothetical protein